MDWYSALITVGLVSVIAIIIRLLIGIWNVLGPYVLYSSIDLREKAGADWAVVTGATDGIGKAYSFELANRGFNIYLVSRTKSKLEDTRNEILGKYPNIEVRTYSYDFTSTSTEDYQNMIDELNKVNIGILINNVGMFFDYPEVLHQITGGVEMLANVVTVNTLPPTLLSAGILAQMVERNSGIIVNIGSSAGAKPMARWSIYSASKKYVSWLTAILRKEYQSHGIIFQTITPFLVATKMSGVSTTSFFTPSAESFAISSLNTIGNVDETTGYITHQIQQEFMNLTPEFVLDRVVEKVSIEKKNEALLRRSQQ